MQFLSGTVTVSLPGNLFDTNLPGIEHKQNLGMAEDGTVFAYNRGVNEWFYELRMRLTDAQRSSLRAFLRNTVQFGTTTFAFTPDTGIDIGAGATTSVAARYWQDSLTEKPIAPGRWEVGCVLHAVSTGTANPSTA